MRELVQDMQTVLRRIEQQEMLWDERCFVARVHALDGLRRQVLERIENVLYVQGYHQELASLYHRAEQLCERLAAVNTALFRRLRGQLRVLLTVTTLPELCDRYVGQAASVPAREGSEEDYLDVLVNGVLGIEQAPEETLPLQSGMIGYVPTPVRVIFALLGHLSLRADDVFYDVGAGLGRVALLVGLLTVAQARGIEVEPAYYEAAQQRARSLHLERVTFINCDARQADYADGTVFFLYTPCTGRMFQEVLDRLHAEAYVRPISIAAYGLCSAQVTQQSWLRLTMRQEFDHDTLAVCRSH